MSDGEHSIASSILKRAVEFDNNKRYTEALTCYQEGLQILMNVVKNVVDINKKTELRTRIENYMSRAEKLKQYIENEKQQGTYHEQIIIENNSSGHSYQSVFGRFLDNTVVWVVIQDPFIRTHFQLNNFLRFCELVIKSCECLKTITLLTIEAQGEQTNKFNMLQQDLQRFRVNLDIQYSVTLHDREISVEQNIISFACLHPEPPICLGGFHIISLWFTPVSSSSENILLSSKSNSGLSNGWIIKIGRGLDYYKAPVTSFSVGAFDMDLRKCHETTVDIFHNENVRQSYG